MKTLNEQYRLIKEGKGHKTMFLNDAKRQFPNYINNAATFNEAANILKQRGVINENIVGLIPVNKIESKKESYELAFEKFLEEAKSPEIKAKEVKEKKVKSQEETEKADLKKPSKQVKDDLDKGYDQTNDKTPDNLIFDQITMGYYAEMKDPKNADKTMQQLKDIVLKNLTKDPIHYTKDGQFGIKGIGYETELPGLGTPQPVKGPYKASGYGDLNEGKEKRKLSLKQIDKKDKKGLTLYKNTENPDDLYYYDGKVLYSVVDGDRKGPSVRMSLFDITGLNESLQPLNEEVKLRKAIREIIDEEIEEVRGGGNYGIPTINTSNLEKGEQKIPTYYILTSEARKALNLLNPGPNASSYDESLKIPHIRVTPSNTMFISDLLYVTLGGMEKGRGTREKQIQDNKNRLKVIVNEIPDRWWSMVRALFKKYAEPKTTVYPVLGKDVLYHEVKLQDNGYKVEKLEDWINDKLIEIDDKLARASSGEVRRGRPVNVEALKKFKKQLADMLPNAKGGMAIIPPPREEMMESLRESIEKDLAVINQEAEHEILQNKLDKIGVLIDKRKSQLGRLDEDEDMKALTDKNKVRELEKDIKKLEQAKTKIEKILYKTKGKKKKVIDEMEGDDDPNTELMKYVSQAQEMYDGGLDLDDVLSKFNPHMRSDIQNNLEL